MHTSCIADDLTIIDHHQQKIAIVLEILGIQYENKFLSFDTAEQKADDFTKVNPNGRIPAIVDHDNGDFALWESGAIVQYLVDRYDKEHKISYAPGTKEYALVSQWIAFQISGQVSCISCFVLTYC